MFLSWFKILNKIYLFNNFITIACHPSVVHNISTPKFENHPLNTHTHHRVSTLEWFVFFNSHSANNPLLILIEFAQGENYESRQPIWQWCVNVIPHNCYCLLLRWLECVSPKIESWGGNKLASLSTNRQHYSHVMYTI